MKDNRDTLRRVSVKRYQRVTGNEGPSPLMKLYLEERLRANMAQRKRIKDSRAKSFIPRGKNDYVDGSWPDETKVSEENDDQ